MYKVLGSCSTGEPVELYRKNRKTGSPMEILASTAEKITNQPVASLDTSWLKFASNPYQISGKLDDYIIIPVPVVTSDIPNRNSQGMRLKELVKFNPDLGRPSYKTFAGKPTFRDHDNENPLEARGVNFDAVLRKVPKYGVYKIFVLSGFDRSKDTSLVNDILNRRRTSYSMGAWVDVFKCSLCGEKAHKVLCEHMKNPGKGGIYNGKLVYQDCVGINFFENSSVGDPADFSAIGNDFL